MKRLNISDAHAGLEPDGRMQRILEFCVKENPDEVAFHGDTFHLNELGKAVFDTSDYKILLTIKIFYPIKIILGNHDWQLRELAPELPIVEPFIDEVGYYHSHWNEFDLVNCMPHCWHMIMARLFGRKKTPMILKEQDSWAFLTYCQAIHTNAIEWAYDHVESKTLIGGHTHAPLDCHFYDSGVRLLNCGDQIDSHTAVWQDGKDLRVVRL